MAQDNSNTNKTSQGQGQVESTQVQSLQKQLAEAQAAIAALQSTKPATNPAAITTSLSIQDIAMIVAQAIQASKEPTPAEKEAAAKEKADADARREELKAEADEWRQQRIAGQNNCDHKKPRGEDCLIGKLFSDGVYRVMCLRCQKWLSEIRATPDMVQSIMQAENLGLSSWENFAKFESGFVTTTQPQ